MSHKPLSLFVALFALSACGFDPTLHTSNEVRIGNLHYQAVALKVGSNTYETLATTLVRCDVHQPLAGAYRILHIPKADGTWTQHTEADQEMLEHCQEIQQTEAGGVNLGGIFVGELGDIATAATIPIAAHLLRPARTSVEQTGGGASATADADAEGGEASNVNSNRATSRSASESNPVVRVQNTNTNRNRNVQDNDTSKTVYNHNTVIKKKPYRPTPGGWGSEPKEH